MDLSASTALSVTEANPTSYSLEIYNATPPFVLVFRQTFNTGWSASVNGQTLPASAHAEVDSFANGWLVNQSGNLRIQITFTPQTTYNALVIISVSTLLIVAAACTSPFVPRLRRLIGWRRESTKP